MVLPGIAFVAFSALASLKIFKCGPDEQAVCFQLTDSCIQDAIALMNHHATNQNDKHNGDMEALLKHAVVVDFGSRMKSLKRKVLAYRDLSPTGNAEAGVRFVQSVLEWAHQVPGAAVILLPMLVDNVVEDDETTSSVTGFLTTIQQRFRAETAGAEPIDDLSKLKITTSLADQIQKQEGRPVDLNPVSSIIQEYIGKKPSSETSDETIMKRV